MLVEMKQSGKPTEIGNYIVFYNRRQYEIINVFDYYGRLSVTRLTDPHAPAMSLDSYDDRDYEYLQIPRGLRLE